MARRCGCSGDTSTGTCSCLVQGQGAVEVTGNGQRTNPYIVSGGRVAVLDTATVDLTLTGTGREAAPWTLKADAKVTLDNLIDVDTTGGTVGQILARKADGTYGLAPPLTAPPGAVTHDGSLRGDGSLGAPLSASPLRDEIMATLADFVLPPSQRVYLGQYDVRIRVSSAGAVTVPAYQIRYTNPHPTLNLLVKAEQASWLQIASNRVGQAIYGEPISSGTGVTLMAQHGQRLANQPVANTAGPYESKMAWRYLLLAPGATLTVAPGLWCSAIDTPNQNITLPLARYMNFSVIPESWMDTTRATAAVAASRMAMADMPEDGEMMPQE